MRENRDVSTTTCCTRDTCWGVPRRLPQKQQKAATKGSKRNAHPTGISRLARIRSQGSSVGRANQNQQASAVEQRPISSMRFRWPWRKRTAATTGEQRARGTDVQIDKTDRSDSPTESTDSASTTIDVLFDLPCGTSATRSTSPADDGLQRSTSLQRSISMQRSTSISMQRSTSLQRSLSIQRSLSMRNTPARRLPGKSASEKQPASLTARAPPRVVKPDIIDARAALQLERFCQQHAKKDGDLDDDKYISSVQVWSNIVAKHDANSAPRLYQSEQRRALAARAPVDQSGAVTSDKP